MYRVDMFTASRTGRGHVTRSVSTLSQGRLVADEHVKRSGRDGTYRRAEVRPEGAILDASKSLYTVEEGDRNA